MISSDPDYAAPDPLQRLGETVRLVDERTSHRRAVVAHRTDPGNILERAGELLEYHPPARLTDQLQHLSQFAAHPLFDRRHTRLRSRLLASGSGTMSFRLHVTSRTRRAPMGPW